MTTNNAPRVAASRLGRGLQRLVTPAALDFWAARVSPLWTWQRPMARLVRRESASADAVTLTLQPNRHWQGFEPGQHLNLAVEIDGRLRWRSYSPSPVSTDPRLFSVTVKAYPQGQVSQRLSQTLQVGDVLPISHAFGAMRLGPADRSPRLMLAAGSGITPLMAMLRQWAAAPARAPLTLCYWARTRAELCYVEELRALHQADDRLTLRFLLTAEAAAAADEAEGRIDAARLDGLALPWPDCEVYACGPDAFVARAADLLQAKVAAFHSESFTPPSAPPVAEGTARITLARRGQTVEVPRGQPLLSALEALGVSVIAGCRRGICHTCSCGKREGSSRDLRDGAVSNEPASALQLCVNAALGDLVLEL